MSFIDLPDSSRTKGRAAGPRRSLVRVASYLYKDSAHGSYYARMRVRGKIHVSESFGTDFKLAKVKLEDWRRNQKQAAERAELLDPHKGHLKSWADCQAAYLKDTDEDIALGQIAAASRDYRKQRLTHLARTWAEVHEQELAAMPVEKISPTHCKLWAVSFAQRFHKITYNNTMAVLKAVLQQAVEGGRLVHNPAKDLKRAGVPRTEQRVPSPDQFQLILEQMRTGRVTGKDGKTYPSKAARNADLAELLCYTASRLHEVAYDLAPRNKGTGGRPAKTASIKLGGLRWLAVDWEKRQIRIDREKAHMRTHGQTTKPIYFPFWEPLEKLLLRLKAENPKAKPGDLIVDCPSCRNQMQQAIAELKAATKLPADFPKLDHHDLRKAFTTWFLAWGVSVPYVAKLLGHSDGGVTLLKSYAHIFDTMNASELGKAQARWGVGSP